MVGLCNCEKGGVLISTFFSSYFSLTKPKVVVLLQITALCAVIIHYSLAGNLGSETFETMAIVLLGGYLTAGGANAINMWYDSDIDPEMDRTVTRAIPSGKVSPILALLFGIIISIVGVIWFYIFTNQVAAFWSLFSILFYVFIYTIWLKRRTSQNIVIGGIAGSTPPIIGWASCEEGLSVSISSFSSFMSSIFDLGSYLPWFMFTLIFLWTPPHFWALALYRSGDYQKVGVPMLPNVKGAKRTILEMKVYSFLLVLISFAPSIAFNDEIADSWAYYILSLTMLGLGIWYGSTIWRISMSEEKDEDGKISGASNSFFVSLLYLALMFITLVSASFGTTGAILGAMFSVSSVIWTEK